MKNSAQPLTATRRISGILFMIFANLFDVILGGGDL
jgi:hypothetical protein